MCGAEGNRIKMVEKKRMNNILLIGGGGHCHSVLDALLGSSIYKNIGVVAKNEENLRELEDDSIIADYLVGIDSDLQRLFSDGWNAAFVTLGSIGNPIGRKKIYDLLKKNGFYIPKIIDKTAAVSDKSEIGSGVYIGKNSVVNIGSEIGDCAIINSGAIVEHDCVIGSFVHISPGTVICGQTIIGDETHVGAGSVVRQGINIGSNVLIGAGSVVVKDIPDNVKAYGNPCRVVK